jgi:hypothetical protein
MFATHFHELTALSARAEGVVNVHVSAHVGEGRITMLYAVSGARGAAAVRPRDHCRAAAAVVAAAVPLLPAPIAADLAVAVVVAAAAAAAAAYRDPPVGGARR